MSRLSATPRRRRGNVAVGPWPQLAAFRPVRLETGGRLQLLTIAFGGPAT